MPTLEGPDSPHCPRNQWGRGRKAECPAGKGYRWATFAGAVWAPEHSALVYGPERLEHLPDVLICLLLP